MFPKEMDCLWGYLYAHFINFNKEEKLLMAALGKEFPEAKKIWDTTIINVAKI